MQKACKIYIFPRGFEIMNYAKISQVAHYAPSQVVTNDDLAKNHGYER